MNSDRHTLPDNQQILTAILEMKTEINGKIDDLRTEMNGKFGVMQSQIDDLRTEMNGKFGVMQSQIDDLRAEMDVRFEDLRLQMMSFDVRIDRIEALTHEVLNVSFNARADVKVLREEVRSWAKDVADLQLKAA